MTLGRVSKGCSFWAARPLNGTGNGWVNRLAGNGAANHLTSGAGDKMVVGNGGNDTLLDGTGNDRLLGAVGNDMLVSGNGFNTLIGGLGADHMDGGIGSDLYFDDSLFNRIIESPGGGVDAVRSTVSHTLANRVETSILMGNAGLAGTRHGQLNRIVQNAAGVLQGGIGNDRLISDRGPTALSATSGRTP